VKEREKEREERERKRERKERKIKRKRENMTGGSKKLYEPEEFSTVNPFTYRIPYVSLYEWLKVILLSVTLAPIRILLCVVMFWICMTIVQLLLLFGGDQSMSLWRRKAVYFMIRVMARSILFICGFYWMPTTGQYDTSASVVVSNHSTMFDFLIILCYVPACYVMKADVAKTPLVGRLAKVLQCIPVDRQDPHSRKKTIEAIDLQCQRIQKEGTEKWSPLVVFPEATTTNGRALISFKYGAFMPQCPVQPVLLRYPFVHDELAWLPGGGNFRIWRHFCQFVNFVTVDFLPVVTSDKDQESVSEFAHKVRRKMANYANISLTSHSFDDVLLSKKASKSKKQLDMIEMGKVKEVCTSMNLAKATKLLEKFSKIDKDQSGTLSYEEFCSALGLPQSSSHVEEMFQLLDVDQTGEIDFREYLVGSALLSQGDTGMSERMKFVFSSIDLNHDGKITFDEMKQSLQKFSEKDWTDEAIEHLYECAQIPKDAPLDFATYEDAIQKNPVYFHIFFNTLASLPSEVPKFTPLRNEKEGKEEEEEEKKRSPDF